MATASIPDIPFVVGATINSGSTNVTRYYSNANSSYDSYAYEFQITLTVVSISNSISFKINLILLFSS